MISEGIFFGGFLSLVFYSSHMCVFNNTSGGIIVFRDVVNKTTKHYIADQYHRHEVYDKNLIINAIKIIIFIKFSKQSKLKARRQYIFFKRDVYVAVS